MDKFSQTINNDNNIISAFLYGSHVYGTNHKDSDNDFICIVHNKETINPLSKFGDVTTYTINEFQQLINNHEISALECIFSEDKQLKNNHNFEFNLDKQILRNAISSKSSNSWVKAKKKFIIEQDFNPYIGKKSAWHALRILNFGTQIAENGKIINFSSVNNLFQPIMELNSWEEIDSQYRTTYNEMASQFRLVAPKEKEEIKSKIKIK